MILEVVIPSISVNLGSLSVKITGNNLLKLSKPILYSILSKNLVTSIALIQLKEIACQAELMIK